MFIFNDKINISRGDKMLEKTNLFNSSEVEKALIYRTIREVYDVLKERGYNPVNQIVGYLVSGDPGYISSYKNAREKILTIDRAQILIVLLESYIEQ